MYHLDGKVALVTGGATGIGRSIALRLALEGCDVAIFDINPVAAEMTAEEAAGLGRRAIGLKADVTAPGQVEAGVKRVVGELGRIDVLVNNAGIVQLGPFLELTLDDFDETLKVNVSGTIYVSKAVVPGMVERRGGSVINLASWAGKSGRPMQTAYSASKFAVVGFTQALASELGPYNVRVNAICPGIVVGTEMRSRVEQRAAELGLPSTEERVSTIPLGRVSEPEEIAKMAAFLASDQADYITGQSINVTGGLWMD